MAAKEDKSTSVKAKRCFVITPIGISGSPERLHADWILNAAIKPVFEPRGYEVFRSDTIADPAMINDAIFDHVTDDEICIADLSFLNPNVFYELGVRHALLKPVIHIAHDAIRLPFDTAQHRAIFFNLTDYYSVESLKKQLAEQLATIEADGFKVSNPLTHAKGRQNLASSGDSKDKLVVDLISRIERLESGSRAGHRSLTPPSSKELRNILRASGSVGPISDDIIQFTLDNQFAEDIEFKELFTKRFGFTLASLTTMERDKILYVLQGLVPDEHLYAKLQRLILSCTVGIRS